MNNNFIAQSEIIINAPVTKVWRSFTDPVMIKQYLFGTEVISDWKEGSKIIYRGTWQGKKYEDKGRVINITPEKLLKTTYWSSMNGLADEPKNYKNVTYSLAPVNRGTKLTITQDGNVTDEEKIHSAGNWDMVLSSLKKLLEKNKRLIVRRFVINVF